MATTEPGPSAGVSDLESLQQERRFLLRSLADLDVEHQAGDIEEEDYRTLADGYTARAATVVKAIEALGGGSSRARERSARTTTVASHRRTPAAVASHRRSPSAGSAPASAPAKASALAEAPASDQLAAVLASRRRWRTAAIAGSVAVFGAVAAWAVVVSTGSRLPGQTITGNAQISAQTTATVAGGGDSRLIQAAQDATKGDYLDALKLYSAVLKDDPNQPVALADQGWLEAQVGLDSNQPTLVTNGLTSIVQSEKADSSYAEPHFFRGYVLLHTSDAPGAVTEFRNFLGLADPDDPNIDEAKTLLQQAINAAGPNVPPGPNAATTTTAP